jgi:hypothetical protein
MANPTVTTINLATGEQTVREYTDDEMSAFNEMPPTVENTFAPNTLS